MTELFGAASAIAAIAVTFTSGVVVAVAMRERDAALPAVARRSHMIRRYTRRDFGVTLLE
jgi:hypothetical protein